MLALLFLICSAIAVGIISVQMPPYQNPDELHHFLRADQLSRFGLLPERLSNGATGAFVDAAVVPTALPFLTVAADTGRRVTRDLYQETAGIRWSGELAPVEFANTAIYPPAFYLPAVAAIWIGKGAGASVLHTFYGARVANGLCASAIGTGAILLADGAALWLFALLSLPMTLSLFCAVSQDGPMIACTALAVVVLARMRYGAVRRPRCQFALLCLLFAAVCMARPPYAPLACLVLMARWRNLVVRATGLVGIGLCTAAWSVAAVTAAGPDAMAYASDIAPGRQLAESLRHPLRTLLVMRDTLETYGVDYLRQLVGRLGAMDTPLPASVHRLAWSVLIVVAAYSAFQVVRFRSMRGTTLLPILGCCVASVLLILGIQYLTFSPVGSPLAHGIQGRYFIEVLLCLGVVLYVRNAPGGSGAIAIGMLITFCPVFYLAHIVRAMLLRYYLL